MKQLVRKQNLKNLSLSLAKRHQKLGCSIFINSDHKPNLLPLFSTKKKFGTIKLLTEEETRDLRYSFDEKELLSGILLESSYVVIWLVYYDTK